MNRDYATFGGWLKARPFQLGFRSALEQSRAFAVKNAGDTPEPLAVLTKSSNELIGHMVFHPGGAGVDYAFEAVGLNRAPLAVKRTEGLCLFGGAK